MSFDADPQAIRKAWHKLALIFHPDRVMVESQKGAAEQFKKIREAYDILSDQTRRSRYDEKVGLKRHRREWQQQRQQPLQAPEDRDLQACEIHGVPRDATLSIIRANYRKSALKNHPDKFDGAVQKERAHQRLNRIQQAYEILNDEDRRRRHDRQLELARSRSIDEEESFPMYEKEAAKQKNEDLRRETIYELRRPKASRKFEDRKCKASNSSEPYQILIESKSERHSTGLSSQRPSDSTKGGSEWTDKVQAQRESGQKKSCKL